MDESTFTQCCAVTVRADGDLTVREAGALAVVAGGDATMTQAGSGFLVAGGDVALEQAGVGNMFVGGSAELHDCRIGQMVTAKAEVSGGKIGLLIGAKVAAEDSQVMLATPQAAALGAAAGGVLFLLLSIFRRR